MRCPVKAGAAADAAAVVVGAPALLRHRAARRPPVAVAAAVEVAEEAAEDKQPTCPTNTRTKSAQSRRQQPDRNCIASSKMVEPCWPLAVRPVSIIISDCR